MTQRMVGPWFQDTACLWQAKEVSVMRLSANGALLAVASRYPCESCAIAEHPDQIYAFALVQFNDAVAQGGRELRLQVFGAPALHGRVWQGHRHRPAAGGSFDRQVSQSYICYKIYSCLRTVYMGYSHFYGIFLQTP